jgi:hypothetical protein
VRSANAGATAKGASVATVTLASTPASSDSCYYVGYALCVLIGGGVLAADVFLLFLVLCDWLDITDSAGNSGALLVLVACEISLLSIYGVIVVRIVKARINEALHHMPSYRREPSARR